MPRKTLTALEPVMLPRAASAVSSWIAATCRGGGSGRQQQQHRISAQETEVESLVMLRGDAGANGQRLADMAWRCTRGGGMEFTR